MRSGGAARTLALLASLAFGCSHCANERPPFSASFHARATPAATDDGSMHDLLAAARATRARLQAGGDGSARNAALAAQAAAVERAARRGPQRLARFLQDRCRWFAAEEPAKITAYYEPLLQARRQRDDRFRYPLYAMPGTAVLAALERRLGHPPRRADIDGADALSGLGLEVAWLDDPVARFFLHVQGSGRLQLEDGSVLRAAYAGNNGAGYRSVGSIMLERGLLQPGNASAPAMRAWLAAHADARDALLFENPRYIFFRLLDRDGDGAQGPVGAFGVPLTPERSVATDPVHVAGGNLLHIRSRRPRTGEDGTPTRWEAFERIVFSHDAGAAIQGPSRVDVFWGTGEAAGTEAGHMNESGQVHVLLCGRARRMTPN
ncbi:MAG TPA: MltA domain-containing protein [Candidatus Limnocylindrales bacterium]|nr:MltA domain-containing protein [Candidatus Limnocylindrales bacterium]